MIPLPSREIIDDRNRVPPSRQMQSGSPSTIAVPTQYGDLHAPSALWMSRTVPTQYASKLLLLSPCDRCANFLCDMLITQLAIFDCDTGSGSRLIIDFQL